MVDVKKGILLLLLIGLFIPLANASEEPEVDNIQIRDATIIDNILYMFSKSTSTLALFPLTAEPGETISGEFYYTIPYPSTDICLGSKYIYLMYTKDGSCVGGKYIGEYTGCWMCSSVVSYDFTIPNDWQGDYKIASVITCGIDSSRCIVGDTISTDDSFTLFVDNDDPPQTHLVCNNNEQCVSVTSPGADECTFNSDCIENCIDTTYYICSNGEKVDKSDICNCNRGRWECPTISPEVIEVEYCGDFHFECIGLYKCGKVPGEGTDTCSSNNDCGEEYHSICSEEDRCEIIKGEGMDECRIDENCEEKEDFPLEIIIIVSIIIMMIGGGYYLIKK